MCQMDGNRVVEGAASWREGARKYRLLLFEDGPGRGGRFEETRTA